MSVVTCLVLAGLAVWAYRRLQHRGGAGASAAARARQLRTPAVRLATLLGIHTRAEHLARRYDWGAEGERRTARRLNRLRLHGWTILHDRALPTGRANVDHLAISPTGTVVIVDTKRWGARHPVYVDGDQLMHGGKVVTGRLDALAHEAAAVARALGVPVVPLVVVDGAPVADKRMSFRGVRIVSADRACDVLQSLGRAHGASTRRHLTELALQKLPPRTGVTR
ncbi:MULTISPECIES: nuclease-related domain-containing protein [unclassified Streptomyces]|uniref:nuclease-related domain-containing protein n=1 Tax=unclassified Streptomyces TaxID=2593676 RepID=UPI00035FAD1C|nr:MULTISPECIES: nuclease-related domain-containing protein [unclassified Streptomyces]MYX37820.1 NERD domain-containing protein [Streptomyces sp. SID8377]